MKITTTILISLCFIQVTFAQLVPKEDAKKVENSEDYIVFKDKNGIGLKNYKDSILISSGKFKKIEFNYEIGLYVCTKLNKHIEFYGLESGLFDYGYELIRFGNPKYHQDLFEIESTKGKGVGHSLSNELIVPPIYREIQIGYDDYKTSSIYVKTHTTSLTKIGLYGTYLNKKLVLDTIYTYYNEYPSYRNDSVSNSCEFTINGKSGILALKCLKDSIIIDTIVPFAYDLIRERKDAYYTFNEVITAANDSFQIHNLNYTLFTPLTDPIYCKNLNFEKTKLKCKSDNYNIVKGVTHSEEEFSVIYNTQQNLGHVIMKSYKTENDCEIFSYTSMENKKGYIELTNDSFRQIVPAIYDELKDFYYDGWNLIVSKDGKWGGIFQQGGEVVLPFEYNSKKELKAYIKNLEEEKNAEY